MEVDYAGRVILWKAIVVAHVHAALKHAKLKLHTWATNYGSRYSSNKARDDEWAQWVCDCLNSVNGKTPFMLD
jgi:hypothetical protein